MSPTALLIIILLLTIILIICVIYIYSTRTTKPDAILGWDVRDPNKIYSDFILLIPTSAVPKRKHLIVEVQVKDGEVVDYE